MQGFQRVSYDPNLMICVKFSDDMGRNEEGIDLGGPRREFLRLLMETMARSPMFEEKENGKNLALDSAGNDHFNIWGFFYIQRLAFELIYNLFKGTMKSMIYQYYISFYPVVLKLLERTGTTQLAEPLL